MKCIIPLTLLALAVPVLGETASPKPKSATATSTSSTKDKSTKKPAATEDETSSSTTSTSTTSKSNSTGKDSDQIKEGPSTDGPPVAAVSSIEPEDIQGFDHYAPQIQALIRKCLDLTKMNLTYTFGSADPKNGGMDCSGTIYFVLHDFGFKGVPRQSNEMAEWVEDKTLLYRVEDADSLSHGEFGSLQPGNLLFWSGTYNAGPRKTPVTHVMLYLGKLKSSGKHIVFGASDGRAYQGKRRTGVSVFDFSLPKSASTAKFYGYGMIPGVGKIDPPKPAPKPEPASVAASQPAPSPKEKSTEDKKVAPMTAAAPVTPPKKLEEPDIVNPVPEPKPEPVPKPKVVPMIVVAEAGRKPDTALAAKKPEEEVRPAIRVDSEESAKTETVALSKPAVAKPTETAKVPKSSTTIKKTSSTSNTKKMAKPVVKRKPAPPPTPLQRVQRATGNFLDNVRRSLP